MAGKWTFFEVGAGNDLHGGDYTKAAIRAVQDAIHHSSLPVLKSRGIDPESMEVEVIIGAQRPEKVDRAAVAAALPHGKATVRVEKGGLDIGDTGFDDISVIANAAILVAIDLG
ncbi:MAG: Lin0512 family protein [Acetobacteraceae bacterium]